MARTKQTPSTPRRDTYQLITDRIIALLEFGTAPWRKPWAGADQVPTNLKSGKAYRGINVFLLSCLPYGSPYWLTFKQAKERGGSVRKGEKGCPVVFWKWRERKDAKDTPGENATETGQKRVPLIRHYTVFNVEQCDGVYYPKPETAPNPDFRPIDVCEQIVAGYADGPAIATGPMACYRPATDQVHLPDPSAFHQPEGYYATLFHELGHSTGHATRLARKGVTDPIAFGSHAYSREELIAEMTAAYVCGQAGIETATLDNTAAYLASWLQVLRGDSRLVVQAAASAQKAVDHILGVTFEREEAA